MGVCVRDGRAPKDGEYFEERAERERDGKEFSLVKTAQAFLLPQVFAPPAASWIRRVRTKLL